MQSAEVDDDTCIALAVLHGAEFYKASRGLWWVRDDVLANKFSDISHDRTGTFGAPSRAFLARLYCEHFGLI
jgi:hypothetical protein